MNVTCPFCYKKEKIYFHSCKKITREKRCQILFKGINNDICEFLLKGKIYKIGKNQSNIYFEGHIYDLESFKQYEYVEDFIQTCELFS